MLKRLEIYGFKSFAEKTIIEFDSDINGIVGPNGSGKSNIVDAIKWCLGEQSLKEIRAKTPTDIIFAGSESKPQLNYCEVTITFDNQKRIFPIDYEEVSITRKIYRSGETEYFINRTPCRLKDIKDLILDTGLSSDGYSIIPQGKVEFVVSAKPEERRLLFEETAGIAKYKVKREEALKKLERVKLDMARVEDILAYLKDQMSSLEQAVKKAKNYQKYKQELEMLESAHFVKQIYSIEQELQTIESLYQELISKYTPLATEITSKEAQGAEIKLSLTELEKEFIKFKDDLAYVETQISLATQKIENYKQEIFRSEENINKVNLEIETLKDRNQVYTNELLELKNKKISFEENINSLYEKKLAYQQEYNKYRDEISSKQEILKEKNKQISEISYTRAKIKNDIVVLSKELQRLHLELNSVNKEVTLNEKEKVSLEEKINDINKMIAEFENTQIKLEQKINQLSYEINNILEQLKQKRILVEEKNKEFYALSTKLENIDKNFATFGININKIAKLLEEKNLLNLCVPIRTLLKIPSTHYSMISSYLGNRLLWFVVEKEKDALEISKLLKENSLGFATFIIKEKLDALDEDIFYPVDEKILQILNYDKKFDKVVKFLFSKIELIDDGFKSDFIFHSGKYEIKEEPEDFYTIEVKLNNVSSEIKVLNEEIQDLNEKYQKYIEEKGLLEKELVSLEAQIKQLKQLKIEKEEYLKSVLELAGVLSTNSVNLEKQIQDYESKVDNLNIEVKNFDDEEKKLREEINVLLSEISQLQSNKVVDEYLNINSEYARFEEQYNNLLSEIETKNSLINMNEQKLLSLEKEIKDVKEYILKTQQNIVEEENNLNILLSKRENLVKEIADITSQLDKKRITLNDLEVQIKDLINQKEQLQQQINNLEMQKSILSNNKNNYINLLKEKYNLTLDEAKDMYGDVKDVDVQQIEKLKKRIESMGAINLAAPEEYAQLEEKYNLLVTQQQDLIKSQQDLKDAIFKINQQISINFKETFQKVRSNFINLCNILFEGGNAELVLTDENNILDSGIEIIVQPPGKKHQNINLLSGGEKSLVAFALLFSFFMVKPSAVCILDEADAQLDDTNVVRFMKLLKEFSKNTEFILITHNTRTMEFIDTLYGITMEELGVSKIIAIKLQKAEVAV